MMGKIGEELSMTPREVLEKMLEWIEAEKVKALRPNMESFVLMSLMFCAGQVAPNDPVAVEKTRQLLHKTTEIERQVKTHDIMVPQVAIFVINRTLEIQC